VPTPKKKILNRYLAKIDKIDYDLHHLRKNLRLGLLSELEDMNISNDIASDLADEYFKLKKIDTDSFIEQFYEVQSAINKSIEESTKNAE